MEQMSKAIPIVSPPYCCAICGGGTRFSTVEHIVPESLGNDFIVLAKGWVCDTCNNLCSSFESRALGNSILGVERCRLGVITKKRKPARAKLGNITWFAEPDKEPSTISVEAEWDKVPVLLNKASGHGVLVVPLHDKSNEDICRMLLKIGLELLAVQDRFIGEGSDRPVAQSVVMGNSVAPWPYFILITTQAPPQLKSIFEATPDEHRYVRGCNFDLYLHSIAEHQILVFEYGNFLAAISITSRESDWIAVLSEWNISIVGCPKEFDHLST